MDITEAFRGEDIAKTDFFDFVVTPEVNDQPSVHFNRTLKSMGIFLDSSENENNHNQMGGFSELKEANNNHLMMSSSSETSGNSVGNFDSPFWSSMACEKEAGRIESAILEDLNKFCWPQDPDAAGGNGCHKGGAPNTDGAIYTLTVLNGGDHATWYRPPEGHPAPPPPPPPLPLPPPLPPPPPAPTIKEENQPSPHSMDCQQFSSGSNHPNHSSPMDLDSILSIMPNSNSHQFHPNGYHPNHHHHNHHHPHHHHHHHPHHHHHHHANPTAALSPHQQPIKSESQYSYEDNGFVNKDCNTPIDLVMDGPLMETGESNSFSNSTNEWKHNNESNAESLLRNALQGKSFMGRYNGAVKTEGSPTPMDGHAELRRVLSTPPGGHSSSKASIENSPVFLNNPDVEDNDRKHSPLMPASMESSRVMFEDGSGTAGGRLVGMVDSERPGGTGSMDDILLSHLDAASYPEDYEKLKSIANEVAESVNQYCGLDQNGVGSPTHQAMYLGVHLTPDGLGPGGSLLPSGHPAPPLPPMPLPAPPTKSKKCSKKASGGSGAGNKGGPPPPGSGVRKERSLHYCNICSKGFKDKYSVNVHIRTHTGEKPFTCSLCGKSFRQKAHLAKHYQTHLAQKAGSGANGVAKSSAGKARFSNPKPS